MSSWFRLSNEEVRQIFQVAPPLHQGPTGGDHYSVITLPNKLEILLISSPHLPQLNASLSVQIGNITHASPLPGLAQYIEKLMCLGSKQHPKPMAFESYLATYNGTFNSETQEELTTFNFQHPLPGRIEHEKTGGCPAYKSLERFCEFITSPLFDQETCVQEIYSIQSQFEVQCSTDEFHVLDVERTLYSEKHPTCLVEPGLDQELIGNLPGARKLVGLVQFYHDLYYTGNLMKLCVQTPYSLTTMKEWMIEIFSSVSNFLVVPPVMQYQDIPLLRNQERVLQNMVATKSAKPKLIIKWIVRGLCDDYPTYAAMYLGEILRNKDKGGLFHYLKKRGWCTDIKCETLPNLSCVRIVLHFSLTKDAIKVTDKLIYYVYGFIGTLRQQAEDLFLRCSYQQAVKVQYDNMPVAADVKNLSKRMQYRTTEHVLTSPHRMMQSVLRQIKKLVYQLLPSNAITSVTGEHLSGNTDSYSGWLNAPFRLDTVMPSTLDSWNRALNAPPAERFSLSTMERTAQRSICTVNPFSTDMEIGEVPNLLGDEVISIYSIHNGYSLFVQVTISMSMEIKNMSATSYVLSHILGMILKQKLDEELWDKMKLNLKYSVQQGMEAGVHRLSVVFETWKVNIESILKIVVKTWAELKVDDEKILAKAVEEVRRQIIDQRDAQANVQAESETCKYLSFQSNEYWHIEDCLKVFEDDLLNADTVMNYQWELATGRILSMHCLGAMSNGKLLSLRKIVLKSLSVSALSPKRKSFNRLDQRESDRYGIVDKLPYTVQELDCYVRKNNSNKLDESSSLKVMFILGTAEPGTSEREADIGHMLAEMIRHAWSKERNKMGNVEYNMRHVLLASEGLTAMDFVLQSDTLDVEALVDLIDDFLENFQKKLKNMGKEEFAQYREWYWRMKRGEKIQKRELLAFCEKFTARKSYFRRNFVCQIVGKSNR